MTRISVGAPGFAAGLKLLRYRKGKSLKELQKTVGVSPQVMSRWENGSAQVPEGRLPLYLEAVGATEDDLEREISLLSDQPPQHLPGPKALVSPFSGLESHAVTDESMAPWAEPGENVWFKRGQHPKRFEGCVVDLRDGRTLVRLYERERDGHVFLRRVNPDEAETFLHSDITALHRIHVRGL